MLGVDVEGQSVPSQKVCRSLGIVHEWQKGQHVIFDAPSGAGRY